MDEYIPKYFAKDHVVLIRINECNKSALLTSLREVGNIMDQYVTSVRYCDLLYFDSDEYEIYMESDDYCYHRVYSPTHDKCCDHCLEYKENVKKNKIVGIKIYPNGVIAPTRKERIQYWKKFNYF